MIQTMRQPIHHSRILVTGGAGFIGSHLIRSLVMAGAELVVNLDALTYAGDLRRLHDVSTHGRYRFVRGDLRDKQQIESVLSDFLPHMIVHVAAESHVTRSEYNAAAFRSTNLVGTRNLLEAASQTGITLFLHLSTDEVYGPIAVGRFAEGDKEAGDGAATNVYAKSKSLADDLVCSYRDRLAVIITRPTNIFGPYQMPEKAIARWITRGLRGKTLPVWGDGQQVRQWLYIDDLLRALYLLMRRGEVGEVYNVGPTSTSEQTNLQIAIQLANHLRLDPRCVQLSEYDRPNHDRRYGVDSAKIRALGWESGRVEGQLRAVVDWYQHHSWWWRRHIATSETLYNEETSRV